MTRPKTLSCGGKGPCCHIGYAHRHCEHCDVVIATAPAYVYPWINPPYRPYQPYWYGSGNVANAQDIGNFVQALSSARATAADQSYNAQSLPTPTTAHACEVVP